MIADEISIEEGSEENETFIKSNLSENLKNYFSDYGTKTRIYGFNYLVEPNRSIYEKIYWLVSITLSFVVCLMLIGKIYTDWKESPITLAQVSSPIWQVPFPAVTICSETKIKQRSFNFTDYYHKMLDNFLPFDLNEEELEKFTDVSLACGDPPLTIGNSTTTHKVFDHLAEVAPKLEEVFFHCSYHGKNIPCKDLFVPTITEDGICFNFNMMDRRELFKKNAYFHHDSRERKSKGWTPEEGYTSNSLRNNYPERAVSAGLIGAFTVLLRTNEQDLDYICSGPVQGFKIFVHNPAEGPSVSETKYFRAGVNKSLLARVEPKVTKTSSDLRNLEPSQRQCFFGDERKLKFFNVYTQQNCREECIANYTLKKCHCVGYYSPREEKTNICGAAKGKCSHEAQEEALHLEAGNEMARLNQEDENLLSNCNCLPSCNSLGYNTEVSQADLDWIKVFQSYNLMSADYNNGTSLTRVSIVFKNTQFISLERRKLYSRAEFLGYCGGLLALFTGFSLFSILEIVYYLSLRLFYNVKLFGVLFWSGSRSTNDNRYLPR